mgnify:CR=1 FL=1
MASVWGDVFHHPDDESVLNDTVLCIRWMYRQMEYGYQTYPGFFTHHSMGFIQQDAAGRRHVAEPRPSRWLIIPYPNVSRVGWAFRMGGVAEAVSRNLPLEWDAVSS